LNETCGVPLGHLVHGRLTRRVNRFVVEAEVGGRRLLAHVPNTGRLDYALFSGAHLWMRRADRRRLTLYDTVLAGSTRPIVVVDSSIQNRLLEIAVTCGLIPELRGYSVCGREVTVATSRVDFLLCSKSSKLYVEVKGATLAVGRCAVYPDAPTRRGKRHVDTLRALAEEGAEAAVVFVALRPDVCCFRPNWDLDPRFALALKEAANSGVKVLAYSVGLGGGRVTLGSRLAVDLE
jgi:sugar fermentation stimulation protein A